MQTLHAAVVVMLLAMDVTKFWLITLGTDTIYGVAIGLAGGLAD